MKIIDYIIQTLCILTAFVFGVLSFFDNEWMLAILIVQFLFGAWQLTGSLISVLLRYRYHELKLYHLVTSTLYILFLMSPGFKHYNLAVLMIPSWSLGVYYYVLTCLVTFNNNRQSSFLPHLSF